MTAFQHNIETMYIVVIQFVCQIDLSGKERSITERGQ